LDLSFTSEYIDVIESANPDRLFINQIEV